ncbi:MAG: hypothetical protein OZ918_07380 [Nitrospirales bacterium]|nr:hypothetical protein [Nitrospira sp. NTP2]MEB2338429.1 hypothetical protein [Nitrospirales bacterium]QOJ36247.1 MAG: hypothetical protein HRU82_15445 [Nitrospira sp.]
MNPIEVPIGSTKYKPCFYDESHFCGFRADCPKGPTLGKVIQDCLLQVFHGPFKQGNTRHVVRSFDSQERNIKLH